jgi:hypothetical protein
VVADHFLRNSSTIQTIWLIHSEKRDEINQEGTYNQAKNLKELLQRRFSGRNLRFEFVSLSNVSRAKEIEKCLTDKCIKKLEKNSSIHVNYTGGTKVMCTHVYRTIDRLEHPLTKRIGKGIIHRVLSVFRKFFKPFQR